MEYSYVSNYELHPKAVVTDHAWFKHTAEIEYG